MTDKVKIKAIIKQYADKGKKMYRETVDSRGLLYNAGFWDGYECCAKGLLRELEDVQEESINNGLDLGCGVIWKEEESASEDLEEVAHQYYKPNETFMDGFKKGANWKKEQFEKNRLKHCNSITNEQAELEQGFIDQHLDKYNRMPTFLDAIEYGMNLQKEQIMQGAIEIAITGDCALIFPKKIGENKEKKK